MLHLKLYNFQTYFDNVLTDDQDPDTDPIAGQYDPNDPMYGMYRRAFMNLAPSYEQVVAGSEAIYKLDETIRTQNEARLEAFTTQSNNFVALGIDSLYELDDEGVMLGLSDITTESTQYKEVAKALRDKYGLDNDGVQELINDKLMAVKSAFGLDSFRAADMMTLDEDMNLILGSLSPTEYWIYQQQFDEVAQIFADTQRGAIIPTAVQPPAGATTGAGSGTGGTGGTKRSAAYNRARKKLGGT